MPITDPGPEATLTNRAPGKASPNPLWYALVNAKLMYPNNTHRELAALCKCAPITAQQILNTTWARARLDQAGDIRPYLHQQVRVQALDALDATGKAVRRFNKEIDRPKPQPAVLNAGMTAAIKTLEGIGIFKQHGQLDVSGQIQTDYVALRELLADPDIAQALATDTPDQAIPAPATPDTPTT